MLATSSSQTAATITSPLSPARTASAPASMIAASPAFMSYEPRPWRRPFSTAGSNGCSMPATPTVSRCAFRSSVLPPPEPRAIPTALKRPGATSSTSTSRPGVLQPPATKRAISPSPAAPSIRSGLIESMRTRSASSSRSSGSNVTPRSYFSALAASSGASSSSSSRSGNSTSRSSMRCPSTSTTSKRSPSCSTSSRG